MGQGCYIRVCTLYDGTLHHAPQACVFYTLVSFRWEGLFEIGNTYNFMTSSLNRGGSRPNLIDYLLAFVISDKLVLGSQGVDQYFGFLKFNLRYNKFFAITSFQAPFSLFVLS